MPRRAMLEDLEPRQDVPEWQGKICYLAMRCSFWWKGAWNDKKDESGIQYRTTFPKLKVLVKGERFFSKLCRWPRRRSINAKGEKYLMEV
jgi:hypothetical protein